MYKMIIVDDESFELELISSWTLWSTYDIEIAAVFERPSEALSYISQNKIDIILSDICMSDMSGIDFLKEVKKISVNIIFVFITAYNNFEYMHTAIVNNAFDYLMKPLHFSDVQNLCERIWDKLSNEPTNSEPNLALLQCHQSLIDYLSGSVSLSEMTDNFSKNGIDFDPALCKVCIIRLKITDFDDLLNRWSYNIDRLYTAILNISKNVATDLVPLKYEQKKIIFLAILHDESRLSEVLDRFISDCTAIFKCEFSHKLLSEIVPFGELTCELSDILKLNTPKAAEEPNTHFAIKLALKYIEEHLYENISLDMLARHIHLSPYHTSRLFKQSTGDSFVNYINQYRINKSKELLVGTNKTVSEICTETGFLSKNYFTKLFRRYTGQTPSEYRNRYSD